MNYWVPFLGIEFVAVSLKEGEGNFEGEGKRGGASLCFRTIESLGGFGL